MENENGSAVSRRDFIKNLGAGTIGAAIVSKDLLDPRQVEAAVHNQVEIMARPPSTEMYAKWQGIRKTTQAILDEFSSKAFGAKQVNWRLNISYSPDKKVKKRTIK